ncbi:zf-HC2 domain-containing protein [Streptomyces sp. NPDC052682]|uniref:anti-sigma factor family protein n=1 Tax=Streptomyces sp. NPDC052682 TaxID=3154954 RepID=UPI00343AEE32
MSGSRPEREGHLAEQHLGDRLSALVDGELGHDARERVLAHVATCAKCKAEVDAQRRLKNVFAEAAPPPPSESFLARLQGLPAGGDPDGGGTPFGGGGLPGGLPGRLGTSAASGVFGVKRGERFEFDYAPTRRHAPVLPASVSPAGRGFRIHDVSRPETDRSPSRLRLAFVAAGAVSLAALALGGVTAGLPADTEARGGSGTGSNVTPMRTQGSGAAPAPETQRRRSVGPLLGQAQSQGMLGATPVAPTEASAPLLPGVPASVVRRDPTALHALTTPVVAGAAAVSPLIRPLSATQPLALTAWSAASGLPGPGLLGSPVSGPAASPSPSTSSSPPR